MAEAHNLIDATVLKFTLNKDQERAFRIVANHAASAVPESISQPPQLRMYMGGMGGTGKSRVIKALIHFFTAWNEAHRFAVVAPTGTAAALLNGSTYHSLLGIRMDSKDQDDGHVSEQTSVARARERLIGVEYIFMDEVSMLACHELHQISARLANVLNVHDTPFGGMNMIFDFAQLAPTGGAPLYSNKILDNCNAGMKPKDQENVLGKILWQQITTVVILKENMRQTSETVDDQRFRTALTNMRYASCTPVDIAFLRSRITRTGRQPGFPRLTQPEFRNVSVITALNAYKDLLNEEGSKRFARDSGQVLTDFYSVDRLSLYTQSRKNRKRRRKAKDFAPASKGISERMQADLWSCHPSSTTKHVPGKLSIFVGLPIMIRNNDATELCITKGQEATVVGLDSSTGPFGQLVLDTLFLKLINPPKDINVPGLPANVIPMTRSVVNLGCTLTNDMVVNISREQIQVLPNFGMTDYSAQGKTRDWNVVDLTRCRTAMSYYTALSRSSTAEGTVIVKEPPDWSIITKGSTS